MKRLDIDMDKLRSVYLSGKNGDECAEMFGVHRCVIFHRLAEMGIARGQHKFQKGTKFTKEHRQRISRALMGIVRTEEQKRKQSEKMRGRILTAEHRRHISEAQKGQRGGEDNAMWRGGISKRYDPVIEHAHNTIRHLKRTGKLANQPCEVCGVLGEAHHDNYDQPRAIRWLCSKHHRRFHMQNKLVGHRYVPIGETDGV